MKAPLVQLVGDYGPGDLAFAEVAQALELVVPGADIVLTRVPPRATLAAGWCVARLALTDGPPDRLVVHDVAGEAGAPSRFCVGRARDCVEVVGANVGWAWSFVAGEVCGPCYLEVPSRVGPRRAPELLAAAVVRVARRQPHALCGRVPHEEIPPLPEAAVAFADCDGDLETTLVHPPAPVGTYVRVQIGNVAAVALVTDGNRKLAEEQVALGPGASRPRGRAGAQSRLSRISVCGGSAARLFREPRSGAPIALTPVDGA